MSASFLTLLIASKERMAREEGAIALATLIFLMLTGIVSMVTLWSIGYTTSQYNSLYANSQAAAYAAAGRTQENNDGGSGIQLDFDCDRDASNATICTSGSTFDIARETLARTNGPKYNRDNTGAIRLVDENYNLWNGIYAYHVPVTSGTAKKIQAARGANCPYTEVNDGVPTRLICWQFNDRPQYNSGVVIRTSQSIALCALSICQNKIDVAVAATVGQASE